MADQVESGPTGGEVEQPTQPTSPAVSDQQTSVVNVDEVVASLKKDPEFLEFFSRQMQSTKDKRFVEHERKLDNFGEKLERMKELKTGGMSEQQAIDQMNLEDRLASLETQYGVKPTVTETVPSAGSQEVQEPTNVDTDALFRAIGLDPQGAEATQFHQRGEATPERFLEFLIGRNTAQPEATPAQAMPAGSGTTPVSEDADAIQKRLNTVMDRVPIDFDQVRKLKQEYITALEQQ